MKRSTFLLVPTLLATALLAACGGGGSSYGMVQSNPPPTPPPPTPPPVSVEPCSQMTHTSDCVVAPNQSEPALMMSGGRTSNYALIKQGNGSLQLNDGMFVFAAGTQIQAGYLTLMEPATLDSDVSVALDSALIVYGTVTGNIDIHDGGGSYLYGSVTGNLTNSGFLTADAAREPVLYPQHIEGDFTQTSTGVLRVPIAADRTTMLEISGMARLAGMVQTIQAMDWDYSMYPLPTTPYTVSLLHADGGVSGEFDEWTSPGLFVTGALRYGPNDVFLDASAISAQSVMAGSGVADALTLDGAQRFDNLLAATGAAEGTFDRNALSPAQDRLLRSAAIVQRIDDVAQAVRTFDSLSGSGHIAAVDAYLQNALQAAPTIAAHLDATPRSAGGSWAAQPATFAVGGGTFRQQPTLGYDLQFANGTRLGSSVAWSDSTLDLARAGGVARSRAPQFNVYMHRDGTRGYATGVLGFARQQMDLERSIDLGGTTLPAHAQRDVDTTFGYLESGRTMAFGGGRITPFAAAHWSQARAGAFAEQGLTGFELTGGTSVHERFGADIGARWTRDWQRASGHWFRLDAGMRHRHLFQASDEAQVAYVGAPGWMFDLRSNPLDRDVQIWSLGLLGGRDSRWAWSLRLDSYAEDNAVSFGFGRDF